MNLFWWDQFGKNKKWDNLKKPINWPGFVLEMSDLGCQAQVENFWVLEQGGLGICSEAPNGVRGKVPENIWLFDTYKALEST